MTDQINAVSTSSQGKEKFFKKKKPPLAFKNKNHQEVYDWLNQTYPKAFNPRRVRILETDVIERVLERPDLPFPKEQISDFLMRYCNGHFYLKELIFKKHRINLEGKDVADLTEEDKKAAKGLLKKPDPADILGKYRKDFRFSNPKYQEVYEWLCTTYPKAFNPQFPLALASDAVKQLFQTERPFSNIRFRKSLGRYVYCYFHLKAVIAQTHRTHLNGEQAEAISEEEKERARLHLESDRQKYHIISTTKETTQNDKEKTPTDVPSENLSGTDAS